MSCMLGDTDAMPACQTFDWLAITTAIIRHYMVQSSDFDIFGHNMLKLLGHVMPDSGSPRQRSPDQIAQHRPRRAFL